MMFNRKTKSTAPASRSGLPFARAQRLHAQTARVANNRPNRVLNVSLLAIGTVVFFGAHPTASARVHSAIVDAGNGAPVSDIVANFSEPLELEVEVAAVAAEEQIAPQPQTASPAEIVEATPAPAVQEQIAAVEAPVPPQPIFTAQSDAPECVIAIEQALVTLLEERGAELIFAENEAQISALIQSGLACPDAGVRMAGSLELARTDFAHLRFHWDRETNVIDVATVNSAEFGGNETIVATDTTLELVFR